MRGCAHRKISNFSQAAATRDDLTTAQAYRNSRCDHGCGIILHRCAPGQQSGARSGRQNGSVRLADRAVGHGCDGPSGRRQPAQGRGRDLFRLGARGRAIQDVWILPGVFYGTTLRIYDPNIDAWHILWSDPLRQFYTRQIGRARGSDIVQLGKNDAGEAVRWSFTEITPSLVSLARRALARRRQELAGRRPNFWRAAPHSVSLSFQPAGADR